MPTTYYLIVALAFVATICLQFAIAPWRASRKDAKQVSILGGLAQYIEWERNEVVITRRRGKEWISSEKDDTDKEGGSRFIFALIGERMRGRVWLGAQWWTWEGEVSTGEGIPCRLKVMVKFVVDDVSKYIYENKSAKHRDRDRDIDALSMAEVVFKADTQESVRTTVSQERLSEMVILKLPKYQSRHPDGAVSDAVRSSVAEISEKLVNVLRVKLTSEALAHGMRVIGIKVPSIKFAPEVVQKSLNTYLTTFEPLQAEQLAERDRIMNDTQAESYAKKLHLISKELGIPVTQMRELLQHLPNVSTNMQGELAKSIISEFKKLNSKPALKGQESEEDETEATDETEPPDDESKT